MYVLIVNTVYFLLLFAMKIAKSKASKITKQGQDAKENKKRKMKK
jgi:hypothetical protein